MKAMTPNQSQSDNNANLLYRLYIYQKERFPLIGHGVLISVFSFSAISYSLLCRGQSDFISWSTYIIGVFTTITLFLLVRIFDEFKDAEDDAKYRRELPVPRGLVSLNELKWVGIIVFMLQIVINAIFLPKMLYIFIVIIVYLLLMGKEFFIADWLKKRQFWYVTSHMFIIPLIDIYASGLDWFLAGAAAPFGLFFFFTVSYMNGVVLEVGRKIRTPEKESEGVLTYTSMLGVNKAVYLWLSILFVTLLLSIAAAWYAGIGEWILWLLVFIFIICSIPAILFVNQKSAKYAKLIELSSALWTFAMYLSLGGIPMLQKLIFSV